MSGLLFAGTPTAHIVGARPAMVASGVAGRGLNNTNTPAPSQKPTI